MELTPIILFSIGATLTPGPSNALVMGSASNFGLRYTIPLFLGICLGFPMILIASGLGLGVVVNAFPASLLFLKFVGAAYLCYLAYKLFNIGSLGTEKKVQRPFGFLHGAAFHWINPKSWIVALSAISSFSTPSQSEIVNALTISLVFICVSLPCVGIWMSAGSTIRSVLNNEQRVLRFNRLMALLLVLSVVQTLNY